MPLSSSSLLRSSSLFRRPPRPRPAPLPRPPRAPRPLPRAPAAPPPRNEVPGPQVRCEFGPLVGANGTARGVERRPLRLRRLIMLDLLAGPPRPGADAPSWRASTPGMFDEPDCLNEPSSDAAAANRCRLEGGGRDGWSSSSLHGVVDSDRWAGRPISTWPRPRAERTAVRFMAIVAVIR